MRQTQRRFAALFLTLALLLGGCSAPAGDSASQEGPPEEEAVDISGLPEEGASSAEGETAGEDGTTGEEETTLPPETDYTARTGLEEAQILPLSDSAARRINRESAAMRTAYVAGPNGDDPLVEARDWSVYSSPLGKANMSRREAAYYDSIGDTLQRYLTTSGINAVKNDGYYVTSGIPFVELDLTEDQAVAVFQWFLYNNPQYYFISPAYFINDGSVYPCVYQTMANAEKRAVITNQLFDKLEDWVETVESRAVTTYQKELYANNLICENVVYKKTYIGDLRVDQSLYSTVLLGDTVCAGYSKAFCAMMNAMGVDTTAGLSTGHAWNIVRFDDGNYYAVDVCWNDTDKPDPPYNNRYLNVGDMDSKVNDDSRESHTYDSTIPWIPAISEVSYIPSPNDDFPEETASTEGARPAAPANPATAATGETTARTSWDPVSGAEGYDVCFFKDPACTEISSSHTFEAETDHVNWKNVTPGRTYYIGVRSFVTSGGENVYSEWATHSYTQP